MMKRPYVVAASLFLALIVGHMWIGCTSNPATPDETDVVLRGYLYANEPVTDIQLTVSNPIGSNDSTYRPITSASVALLKDGIRYGLVADASRPGYYIFSGSGLSVSTGDIFRIEASYGGKLVTAQTVVPPKPEGVSMSASTMHFTKDTIQTPMGDLTMVTSSDSVQVTWSNASQDYYYLVVESVDSARTLMREDSVGQFGGGQGLGLRFISQPTSQSSYTIVSNSIEYTGKHLVKLYRINKEYADLYRSRMQDSRALNEPLTNVSNGLGVFSAFASVNVEFMVTLDQ
jgi:hypothetical protein